MSEASAPAPSAPAAETSAAPQENQSTENLEALETDLELQEDAASPKAEVKPEIKPATKDVKKAADKLDAEKIAGTKMYKIVVDGQEEEVSEADLVKMAQMGKSGQKRMQEAAQIRKEAIQLVKMLKEDPESVLADPAILGSSDKVLELAQKILAKKIEDEQKSPEILRAEKAERELEMLRKQQKEAQEAKDRTEYEAFVKEQEAQLEEQITEAISNSGLPKSPFVLKRIADVMISAAENDKDITPKQAMNIVKREMHKDLKEYFDLSPDDALEELLGDNNIKRLRKRQLAKVKAAQATVPTVAAKPAQAASKKEDARDNKKESLKDWLRAK